VTAAASYRVWHPSLEPSRDIVSILLELGARDREPVGGREFFEAALAAAGLEVELFAWGCEPFLTPYFHGRWTECWEARLLLPGETSIPPIRPVIGVDLPVDPESVSEPRTLLPARMIADFEDRAAALACHTELDERIAAARWDEPHFDRLAVRDVLDGHPQVVLDITTLERTRIAEVQPSADSVAASFARHGGRGRAAQP
jgi:hypothetical protein